jgi:lipopolysaccharide transport system ATP-binding protein
MLKRPQVIRVEKLSKLYYLGEGTSLSPHVTLRDSLSKVLGAPWRLTKKCTGLFPPRVRFDDDGADAAQDVGKNGKANELWALKDVSFEVKQGEIIGIIGSNGSGKSTLLKILSGIIEPTGGRATIHGRVGSLLEVGTGFHPDLTGRENIYLNGSILGMSRKEIDQKFHEIVAFSELWHFLDTPVKRYSSGMYVRLAFAVAAHLSPDVLLVDEVLAVGDQAFQAKCLGKMDEVSRGGRTVLFISHDMASVSKLCMRTLLLEKGRLKEAGKTRAVITDYLGGAFAATVRSVNGDYDLAKFKGRPEVFLPIIRRLQLHAGDGKLKSLFYPDEALAIDLTLQVDAAIEKPVVAMAIEDSLGARITTSLTSFQWRDLDALKGHCHFTCTFPQLRLGAGKYMISLSIYDKNDKFYDMLHNAALFEVGWRDFYGNGTPYYPVYGPVLNNAVWKRLS